MVEIPDRLECLFSVSIEPNDGSYSIEVPQDELDRGTISAGETYQIAILGAHPKKEDTESQIVSSPRSHSHSNPPVSEGDVREVTIESLGDQGDGIAKIERGYVVIVPGGRPDDEVAVEIQNARENLAFARIHAQETKDESPP